VRITAHEHYRRHGWHTTIIPRILDCISALSLISISWGIEFDEDSEIMYNYRRGSIGLEEIYRDFDLPGFTQMWDEVCRMLAAPRFSTVKTVGLSVETYLFDNQQECFRPLLAFVRNGHVKLLWADPRTDGAAADHWRRLVARDI
jgi:hypothetical protein